MKLDMRTILFITVTFNFMFAIGMLLFNKQRASFRGVSIIGYGFLATGTGFLLMFLRNVISDFFSIVVSNTTILLGVILIFRGLTRFYHKTLYTWITDAVALVVFFLLFFYYLYFEPSINMRVIIICVYLTMYYFLCFIVITHKPRHNFSDAKWFMGIYLVIDALYYLFRAAWTIFEPPMLTFMAAGMVHSIAIISFALLSLVISFGIFIILNNIRTSELEQLILVISHDFRSPLGSFIKYLERIKGLVVKNQAVTALDYLNQAGQQAGMMYEQMDNTLYWVKTNSKELVIEGSEIHLDLLLSDVISLYQDRLNKKNITLNWDNKIASELSINSDWTLCSIIFRNILSNAVKFTPRGGSIRISITTDEHKLRVSTWNSGIPIPEESIAAIYEKKRIASTKGTANEKGTGIGLNLALQMAKTLGAELIIEAASDGTLVSVKFSR